MDEHRKDDISIEVTNDMIEAGLDALYSKLILIDVVSQDQCKEAVEAVFKAMLAAAPCDDPLA